MIDFWLSFLKFSECNLIFFLYDFWIFLVFYYSFLIERKKKWFFWWRGSQLNFFCTHAGFFFFLQIIHVESKIQLHLPIILVAVNAFIGVSDVKEKVLFMVFLKKNKELKNRILFVIFFSWKCNRSGLICYVAYSFDE